MTLGFTVSVICNMVFGAAILGLLWYIFIEELRAPITHARHIVDIYSDSYIQGYEAGKRDGYFIKTIEIEEEKKDGKV